MTAPRIGLNDDGSLDEFVSSDVESFHFEAMGDAQFWMVVRCRDGHEYTINCGAVSTRVRGYCTLAVDPVSGFSLEFAAPCPLGHPATWREHADQEGRQ